MLLAQLVQGYGFPRAMGDWDNLLQTAVRSLSHLRCDVQQKNRNALKKYYLQKLISNNEQLTSGMSITCNLLAINYEACLSHLKCHSHLKCDRLTAVARSRSLIIPSRVGMGTPD